MPDRLYYTPLTERQKALYEWIRAFVERTGEWPTFRQIQDGIGYSSPNSVTQNVKALLRKGWLVRHDTHYDFAEEDMPYLTPQLKNRISERLLEELSRHMTKEQATSAAKRILLATLNDLPATGSQTGPD